VRALDAIAHRCGQSLAKMAIAFVLRDRRITSALGGVRSVAQLEENLTALSCLEFSEEELAEIGGHACDAEFAVGVVDGLH
jgi:L-glyceraldehyde 3-phosphate reductase